MGILSLQLAAGELVEKIQRHLNIDLNCPKRKQIRSSKHPFSEAKC